MLEQIPLAIANMYQPVVEIMLEQIPLAIANMYQPVVAILLEVIPTLQEIATPLLRVILQALILQPREI